MKTAIVTGASRGIGKAIALKLSALGYGVVATGRSSTRLGELKTEIENSDGLCLPLVMDMLELDAPSRIVKESLARFGQIDVLVNNAGISYSGAIAVTDEATWDRLHAVNARVPFFICKEAIPHMESSSNPVIINIASAVGIKGYVDQALQRPGF